MRHEPRGLVADLKGAVELVRGDALLARRHEVEAGQPLVQRDVAALHDGPDRHREILAARGFGAAVDAGLLGRVRAADHAAARANPAVRPALRLEPLAGGVGVLEVGRG